MVEAGEARGERLEAGARAAAAMRHLASIGATDVVVTAQDGGFTLRFRYDDMTCRTIIGDGHGLGLELVREAIRKAEFN